MLFEEKISNVLEQLYPDLEYERYIELENKTYDRIFNNKFSDLCISKIDDAANNLAIMAVTYIGGLDVSKAEWKERWPKENTKRKERRHK
jgi:hypothetical protein